MNVGGWFEAAIDWLLRHFGPLFDGIGDVLELVVEQVARLLVAPHPYVMTAILVGVTAFVTRALGLPIFTVLAFLLIRQMGLWEDAMATLALVLVAAGLALAVGIPAGILAGSWVKASSVIRPILDLMQTLPVFVYLIPAVFLFGIGIPPGVVATAIFATPLAVRLTELGIRQVNSEVIEAAHAFGCGRIQVLREVQLPLALPSIRAGVNQTIMLSLSMTVIAGMVGTPGLGTVVVRGVTQLDVAAGFEGGIGVVILAVFLDRLTGATGQRRKLRFPGWPRKRKAAHFGDSESIDARHSDVPA